MAKCTPVTSSLRALMTLSVPLWDDTSMYRVCCVLQDMSIDVYGRKEDDDAPQEEAPSSSNGVRPLNPYTTDLKRCTNHLGHALCRPNRLSAASLIVISGMQAPQQQTSEKEDDDDDGLDDLFAE